MAALNLFNRKKQREEEKSNLKRNELFRLSICFVRARPCQNRLLKNLKIFRMAKNESNAVKSLSLINSFANSLYAIVIKQFCFRLLFCSFSRFMLVVYSSEDGTHWIYQVIAGHSMIVSDKFVVLCGRICVEHLQLN